MANCSLETYDYIIAGAGTSGLVIANHLSTDPSTIVAIIETGENVRNNPNVTSPLDYLAAFNTSIDWQYDIPAQPGAGGREMMYHAGKAIGGTSTINGMTYIRGDKPEIDVWEALGSEGWNWENLWPYYKKVEDLTPPTEEQVAVGASYVSEFHGRDGLLKTGFPYELMNGSFHETARQSWESLGYPLNPDMNGGDVRGFSVWPMTVDRDADVREDAARAFYYPFEERPNLKIIKGAVKRVIWKESTKKCRDVVAQGVEYLTQDGEVVSAVAKREVILSAGAVRTPLILELSGVGSQRLLAKYGIETVIDLPGVGENLQDQPLAFLSYSGDTGSTSGIAPFATFINGYDMFGNETAAIAKSTKASLASWAAEVFAANDGIISAEALEKVFNIQHDLIFNKNVTIGEILTTLSAGHYVGVFWPLLPFSRGSVHLKSTDAIDDPVIDPNYLLLDFDLAMATGTGRVAQSLFNQEPISERITGNVLPGEEALPRNATDSQWKDFLVGQISPNHHALGTASMMLRELGGVVDSKLKVYGTKNVRVVDASVIPLQISGHLTSTLYAVAERASEIIMGSS
ncbi:uncharacterized protein BCR38DRAFT_335708 [Pseudomassariella vexata]|uniref:Glucose-methanol-choline oxidoreductase N-terminal domain-containing protein n=1 Tax=Pseudomassariella vexata TaxID=1141098 RepID=A0A1Y2E9W3_9PEZI|nr:uncharacterized protein BCR38DRAFT_335708 [Pseudomassariella vexata]ORY68370.1 hypothetical protein BCR38DRAFT_335708 [Pseudomassariella vexata]